MTQPISAYRGYNIIKHSDDSYAVVCPGGFPMTRCATAWGCRVYIDELLSP